MDQARFNDRIHWGMNIAARYIGASTDLYRPNGAMAPLNPVNRVLRLHAAFKPHRGAASRANSFGEPMWYGIFDAAYTKAGDYLVTPDRILFIASQQSNGEPLCVQTNRRVTLTRALPPGTIGTGSYSGVIRGNTNVLLADWPASVLGVSSAGVPAAGLPTDISVSIWTILMPAWPGIAIQPTDFVIDDLGRGAVIMGTELTELGWRLTAKQAST